MPPKTRKAKYLKAKKVALDHRKYRREMWASLAGTFKQLNAYSAPCTTECAWDDAEDSGQSYEDFPLDCMTRFFKDYPFLKELWEKGLVAVERPTDDDDNICFCIKTDGLYQTEIIKLVKKLWSEQHQVDADGNEQSSGKDVAVNGYGYFRRNQKNRKHTTQLFHIDDNDLYTEPEGGHMFDILPPVWDDKALVRAIMKTEGRLCWLRIII